MHLTTPCLQQEEQKKKEGGGDGKGSDDWWTGATYKGKTFLPLSTDPDKVRNQGRGTDSGQTGSWTKLVQP